MAGGASDLCDQVKRKPGSASTDPAADGHESAKEVFPRQLKEGATD